MNNTSDSTTIILPKNRFSSDENKNMTKRSSKQEVECIDLDDDDVVIEAVKKKNEAPPSTKRKKLCNPSESPVPEDPNTTSNMATEKENTSKVIVGSKSQEGTIETNHTALNDAKKETEINSYSALLDRLENYVKTALEKNDNVERKMLDVLLAAINIQVQKEPYSVRKLILDKQLVLPNAISFPPSNIVDLIIEHDADNQLSRIIAKLFGDEKLKLTDAERKERQQLKTLHPAPHMTKLFMDIGLDLVQESTYSDIVHAKNLPEIPKNMDTYNQVAAQLKPVWESLRIKNEPFRLQVFTCQVCDFKTDSRTVLSIHRQTPHFVGRKYQCALCPEFDTNEHRINRHYIESHALKPLPQEELPSKIQCSICEEDFMYKGHRDTHLKLCRRDLNKMKTLQMSRIPDDIAVINRWLWDKPPLEPSFIVQQQQQQARQQQLILQQQQQRAANLAQRQKQLANQLQNKPMSLTPNNNFLGNQTNRLFNFNNLTPQHQQQLLKLLNSNANQLSQLNPQLLQLTMQLRQQQQVKNLLNRSGNQTSTVGNNNVQRQSTSNQRFRHQAPSNRLLNNTVTNSTLNNNSTALSGISNGIQCEICDLKVRDKENYLDHLQVVHKQLNRKTHVDMVQGPPLACSRCRDRFWTYEGLERHLVMVHGLVTSELLGKAQRKEDGGRCRLCGKQYAFNMLQHLVNDHKVKLCSAEIMYSCDICSFRCGNYQTLEKHLSEIHPKNPTNVATR